MGRLVSVDSLRLPGGLRLSSAALDCIKKRLQQHLFWKSTEKYQKLAFFTNSVLPGYVKVPTAVEGAPGAKDEKIYAR